MKYPRKEFSFRFWQRKEEKTNVVLEKLFRNNRISSNIRRIRMDFIDFQERKSKKNVYQKAGQKNQANQGN